ncbi:MAG TPA: efflux RND transporter permease subunit [Planctomycetaceae bacterium]|nr:efflux RND transporter permease subunit [Planctomycetaceae bacterium]
MSLPAFSVRNPVLVNMLMVVILVGGMMFAANLTREMFPEARPNKLLVMAVYPGVQPEEIEKAVTIKFEEAVRDIESVEKVESSVREGLSSTTLTLFNEVKDVDAVYQEVKSKLDSISDLPEDLEEYTLTKLEPKLPVISVALFGRGDEAGLKRAARALRDELLQLPGISYVEVSGTRDDEISVEIRPERLLEYDVTFDEVAEAIRATNLDVSGGQLKGERSSVAVRTLGERQRGVDLEDVVVRTFPDGRKVHVRDVATIRDEFVDTDLESYFNSQPATHCVVFKTGSQDVIQIAGLVKAYVAGKQGADYPQGVGHSFFDQLAGRPDPRTYYEQALRNPFDHDFQVALHTDLARFVEGRLDLLLRNGKTGLVLVLVSLLLFLNWRVAFWAAIGLPVSFLGTFIVMWAFGATINLLSLFGLIIVLGIIVDDAIIVGENIYRHVEEGLPPLKAAVKAAEEVQWPVTIAVLTTIAAFAPLFFVKGQIGDFMSQLPMVVIAALSVSLVEALVILPAHLRHLPSRGELATRRAARRARFPRLFGWLAAVDRLRERAMRSGLPAVYERFLRAGLRWRYVTIAVAVASLLVVGGLWQGEIVKFEFIQKMDSETVVCFLEMPVGTTTANTRQRLERISDTAVALPEVQNVQMFVGMHMDLAGAGAVGFDLQSHLGQLILELKPADWREEQGQRSSSGVLAELRQFSEGLPGVNSVTWDEMSGGPGGKDVQIQVSGRNFAENVAVAAELKAALQRYEGVRDLDDDYDEGKQEVQLRLRESARPTGITVGQLGGHVRSAVYGREARRITRNRESVRIMVRYPEAFRTNVYNLEAMRIPAVAADAGTAGVSGASRTDGGARNDSAAPAPSGNSGLTAGGRGWVPLGEVAELSESTGYSTIQRSNYERSVTVFAELDEAYQSELQSILAGVQQTFADEIGPRHPGVRIDLLGQAEEMGKAFSGLAIAMPVALLLIYMQLAGLFRSYTQPLVVMAAIPFALEGAIVGHWVTGYPVTILSMIGMVALTGIVVNDSLVLVDFINARVRGGMSHFEASVQGGRLRLRAILLTTVTTIAGLTPLMFETSFQARFLIPMAVTLTWGLGFATALTLVVVPALNLAFFDIRRAIMGQREDAAREEERQVSQLTGPGVEAPGAG